MRVSLVGHALSLTLARLPASQAPLPAHDAPLYTFTVITYTSPQRHRSIATGSSPESFAYFSFAEGNTLMLGRAPQLGHLMPKAESVTGVAYPSSSVACRSSGESSIFSISAANVSRSSRELNRI